MKITVESAIEAFEKSGLKPVTRTYLEINSEGQECGCVISSLVLSTGKMDYDELYKLLNSIDTFDPIKEILELPKDFDLHSLYHGYDGLVCCDANVDSEEFKLGIEIRKALEERGML